MGHQSFPQEHVGPSSSWSHVLAAENVSQAALGDPPHAPARDRGRESTEHIHEPTDIASRVPVAAGSVTRRSSYPSADLLARVGSVADMSAPSFKLSLRRRGSHRPHALST